MNNNEIILSKDSKTILKVNSSSDTVIFKKGIEEIWMEACKETKFKNAVFPDTLKKIREKAFYMSKLEILDIENEISLSERVFEGCCNLSLININTDLVPDYCFSGCNGNYIDIYLKNTKEIGYAAFERTKINTLKLPKTLKEIGDYAFCYANFKSKELFLPEGLEEIFSHAFLKTNLTDIYMPKSIKFIDPTIIANENLTVHVYEENLNKLDPILQTLGKIKTITFDKLLETHTFKEINDILQR